VLVYNGWTQDKSEEIKHHLASVVEVFDPSQNEWKAKNTSGETPDVGVKYQICASADKRLYTYGGWGKDAPVKSLHQLNTETMNWSKLSSGTAEEEPTTPMPKHSGGMIVWGNNLALLGGYGIPHDHNAIQPGSRFLKKKHNDGRGSTNEFHIYSLKEGRHWLLFPFSFFASFLLHNMSYALRSHGCNLVLRTKRMCVTTPTL